MAMSSHRTASKKTRRLFTDSGLVDTHRRSTMRLEGVRHWSSAMWEGVAMRESRTNRSEPTKNLSGWKINGTLASSGAQDLWSCVLTRGATCFVRSVISRSTIWKSDWDGASTCPPTSYLAEDRAFDIWLNSFTNSSLTLPRRRRALIALWTGPWDFARPAGLRWRIRWAFDTSSHALKRLSTLGAVCPLAAETFCDIQELICKSK